MLGLRARAFGISILGSGRGGPRYCGGQPSGFKNGLSSPAFAFAFAFAFGFRLSQKNKSGLRTADSPPPRCPPGAGPRSCRGALPNSLGCSLDPFPFASAINHQMPHVIKRAHATRRPGGWVVRWVLSTPPGHPAAGWCGRVVPVPPLLLCILALRAPGLRLGVNPPPPAPR
jgi:hypothetical protein